MPVQRKEKKKKKEKTQFLLPPCLSAWVASLPALITIYRLKMHWQLLTETEFVMVVTQLFRRDGWRRGGGWGGGGGCWCVCVCVGRGSTPLSCFLADSLNCVYSFNTVIQRYAELTKLSCQLKINTVFSFCCINLLYVFWHYSPSVCSWY